MNAELFDKMHWILGGKAHGKGKGLQKLDLGKYSSLCKEDFCGEGEEQVLHKCSKEGLKEKPFAKVTQMVPTAITRYLSAGLTLVIDLCGKIFGWVMQRYSIHAEGSPRRKRHWIKAWEWDIQLTLNRCLLNLLKERTFRQGSHFREMINTEWIHQRPLKKCLENRIYRKYSINVF